MKDYILRELVASAASSRAFRRFASKYRIPRSKAIDWQAAGRESMAGPRPVPGVGRAGLKYKILVRFWFRRVGQPWDAVWGEVCAALRGRPQLLEMVRRYMEGSRRAVLEVEGVDAACWTDRGSNWGFRHVFFVCPASGRLRVRPAKVFPRVPRDSVPGRT